MSNSQMDGNDQAPNQDPMEWPLHMHLEWRTDFEDIISVFMATICPPHMRTCGQAPVQSVVSFNFEPVNEIVLTQTPPVKFMRREQAQRLTDDLWAMGFRPKGDMASQAAQIDAHLEDLKALVEKILKLLAERELGMLISGRLVLSDEPRDT